MDMSLNLILILGFLFVVVLGFAVILNRLRKSVSRHDFAVQYRNNFVNFTNGYLEAYNRHRGQNGFNNELYEWLTKNVDQIQSDMGSIGTMHYLAPFQIYQITNYQIIINTLPKFRVGKVDNFDINSSDDCLIRYIGVLEERIESIRKNSRIPLFGLRRDFKR
jgi:hypothetical protein